MNDPHAHEHAIAAPLRIPRFGLWLFLLSESMIFLALLSARFLLQGTYRPEELNQTLGLTITLILLTSSFTANRAEMAIAHGKTAMFLRNLLATILLGALFLIGVVAFEWPEAMHFAPPSSGYGTVFFSMTGMHAAHVFSGVLILSLVYRLGRRGAFAPGRMWGVEGAIKYWHFVDIVWVFFYPALYLVR
ncbi:MAG: heme-copper oxidase subunit III [Thermoflexus sp.]|jgi:cytochrome c oxidase subunit 3|nr:heme-copper oxidase subunit III [Thermoflexus sp.]MDT7948675.1 heme-copper oxidase subunit III [Thermoflexus sp.]